MSWVHWNSHEGVKLIGQNKYNHPQPWGPWTKIMGVVAKCEGNHDTVVSYDGTGVTWGFMKWTFTSGRLQRLLEYFKSINYFDMADKAKVEDTNLFDKYFVDKGQQIFERYGFKIRNGEFIYNNVALNPQIKRSRELIDAICMGRMRYDIPKDQKKHATNLAVLFSQVGRKPEIAFAQIEFAKGEFKRALQVKRPLLGEYGTLANLLDGYWDSYVSAVFFNLWQNNPAAAYKLFIRAKNDSSPVSFPTEVWNQLKKSKFGNWSYAKPENKGPRIRRIALAVKEFYGVNLPVR